MIVLGIDPGKSGGLALVRGSISERAVLVDCIDVPLPKGACDDLLDVRAILAFLQKTTPDVAYIERVTAMPSLEDEKGERRGMGATSAFNFGGAVYTLRTCVVGMQIPLKRVEVVHWKKAHALSSKDADGNKLGQRQVKERSRQRAIALFGESFFPNIGHHNRAEAALIAWFGLMMSRSGNENSNR